MEAKNKPAQGGGKNGIIDETRQKEVDEVRDCLSHQHLEGFELCGWQYDPQLSWDTNWMDLCMMVTRNSTSRKGSMGCVLVKPSPASSRTNTNGATMTAQSYNDYIITVANNMPLFKVDDSAIHAEIAAIGKASRQRLSTKGATAYITMPPCKRCFTALVAAGIQRIVTRHALPEQQQVVAGLHGISFAAISKEEMEKCHERIQQLVNRHKNKRKEVAEGGGDGSNDLEKKQKVEEDDAG